MAGVAQASPLTGGSMRSLDLSGKQHAEPELWESTSEQLQGV